MLLKTRREQQADRQKRSERHGRLTSQLPSGQLHEAGAGQRGQRGNHQKHGKACDADPNSGGRQQFDVAQPKALDFSKGEIQPSQQPEDGSDRCALACGLQPSQWTTGQDGLRQSQSGDRQIQPP